MQTPIRLHVAALLLAAALPVADLRAQGADILLPDSRVRVLVRSAVDGTEHELTGRAVSTDRDSLRLLREGFETPVAIPWQGVLRLERFDGVRGHSAQRQLATVATVTAVGALAGWSSWHTCRDPEDTTVLSCIVAPGRLGNAVRSGAWVGLGVGAVFALINRRSERWTDIRIPPNRFVFRNSAAGTGIGLRFEF